MCNDSHMHYSSWMHVESPLTYVLLSFVGNCYVCYTAEKAETRQGHSIKAMARVIMGLVMTWLLTWHPWSSPLCIAPLAHREQEPRHMECTACSTP